jgi:hypothetical protein
VSSDRFGQLRACRIGNTEKEDTCHGRGSILFLASG